MCKRSLSVLIAAALFGAGAASAQTAQRDPIAVDPPPAAAAAPTTHGQPFPATQVPPRVSQTQRTDPTWRDDALDDELAAVEYDEEGRPIARQDAQRTAHPDSDDDWYARDESIPRSDRHVYADEATGTAATTAATTADTRVTQDTRLVEEHTVERRPVGIAGTTADTGTMDSDRVHDHHTGRDLPHQGAQRTAHPDSDDPWYTPDPAIAEADRHVYADDRHDEGVHLTDRTTAATIDPADDGVRTIHDDRSLQAHAEAEQHGTAAAAAHTHRQDDPTYGARTGADGDWDDRVRTAEGEPFAETAGTEGFSQGPTAQAAAREFRRLDADNTGELSRDNLRNHELAQNLDEYDINNDGVISENEFQSWFAAQQHLARHGEIESEAVAAAAADPAEPPSVAITADAAADTTVAADGEFEERRVVEQRQVMDDDLTAATAADVGARDHHTGRDLPHDGVQRTAHPDSDDDWYTADPAIKRADRHVYAEDDDIDPID